MAYRDEAIAYDAAAWRRQINIVKVYQTERVTIEGVACEIYQDPGDPGLVPKKAGIRLGVQRVVQAGYNFPNGIRFYLSNAQGFQSVAYHRDFGADARRTVVLLGQGAINTAGMVGRQGVADVVGRQSQATYCAAVVVHELGHNLHELFGEEFFWTPNANTPPNVPLAMEISQYAATNKKEVVAEVFTGMLYGIVYRPAIMNMYAFYEGPVAPQLAEGRRRR